MILLPALERVLNELNTRFGRVLEKAWAPRLNELYLEVPVTAVAALCGFFYRHSHGRLAHVFAEDRRTVEGRFRVSYGFVLDQAGGIVTVQTTVDPAHPELPALTPAVPAVNWQEREIQDLFGLTLVGHPNPRRCALHDDWPMVHPLRKDFPRQTELPPFTGERHQFRKVEGEGVFQVPVGPVHAGIIEPGHFLFSVAGEPILYLQLRLFYTHKGIEKRFEEMPVEHGVRLAEGISGDSSFAHATAFCHAIERAVGLEAPPRARCLRTIGLELERLYNHTADVGAIATDVGFVVANAHALRLREGLLRLNETLTGSRLLRGWACLGGVRSDFDAAQGQRLEHGLDDFAPQFDRLCGLIDHSTSTQDRLQGTGILTPETASDLGVVGIAGRASGVDRDLRRDLPHAGYAGLTFTVPVYAAGDVQHRLRIRLDEIRQSLSLLRQARETLPAGPVRETLGAWPDDAMAWGYVEGWRGEIFHWVRTRPGRRLARCRIKDPSLQNWPALSEAVTGNIIPDFPVINKSFNLSYSGTDR